ncbi:hypothetical protein D6825_02865 [Candidatus Woesearchaeota archaeon]|nr:MAG: hypothetical protein D6825_02865 [Candidatus Woesearchaeota archaeon]
MSLLNSIYDVLLRSFGSQGWWPILSRAGQRGFDSKGYHKGAYDCLDEDDLFEVCIGAILTQNTSWKNVERALAVLRDEGLLSIERIASASESDIGRAIRSAGYYNQKAKKLKAFARSVLDEYGSLSSLFSSKNAREFLLSIWGIGPETADSMLLYAGGWPVFVVDAYTKRICSRLGICSSKASYDELQSMFHSAIERRPSIYNEYHALLVRLAKSYCVKGVPDCKSCPLSDVCSFNRSKH